MRLSKRVIYVLIAVVFAFSAFGCSFNLTTAKVEDAYMTDTIDSEGEPGTEITTFSADAEILYAAAKLLNAPDNTQVLVVWTYLTGGEQQIDQVIIDSGDIANRYIYSSLEPTSLMPEGDYKVEFFVEDREEPDATATFNVTPVPAYLEDAHMTSYMDEGGVPVDTISVLPSTGTWYVTAVLRGATDDTIIRYVWYDIDGTVVSDYTFDPEGATDIYIFGTLPIEGQAPAGAYSVDLFLDDSNNPAASVTFSVEETTAYLEDVHMTSYMDEGGVPADTITVLPPTGVWYVSAILRDADANTIIRYVWYDTTDSVIDDYTFDPQGETDIYIGGTLSLTRVAPAGTYHVDLFINDAAEPAASVSFEVQDVSEQDVSGATGDLTTYVSQYGGYQVDYPSEWVMFEIPDTYSIFVYPEAYEIVDEDDLNAGIIGVSQGAAYGYTTQTALDQWISETEDEGNENYAYIDSGVETVNGSDMAMFAYMWSRSGYTLYTFDFLIVEGSDLYVLSFTMTSDAVADLYPYLEQIVMSFQLL